MFDTLMTEVYGFSFSPWLERKLWDERYESYSFIRDGKMLSNVCIYKTDLLIRGERVRAHQIGAVATLEGERGKSLSRTLIEHILGAYPGTPAFLYAGADVLNFYPRFGFQRKYTYRPVLGASINNKTENAVKYLPDDAFVQKMLYGGRVYSDLADAMNMQSVQMFRLLMSYTDNIYFLPGCGALVVARQKDDKLFIADVITEKPLAFDILCNELPFNGVELVEFGFCPDWLGAVPRWERMDWDREPVFFFGDWELPEIFRFPVLSAT